MTSGINIKEYRGVPARALNMSIRNFLATMLDREEVSTTSRNHCKNWEGLAELLGFNYEEIIKFNNHGSRGKTKMLLGDYTMGGGDVAKLLQSLQELERFDILEDVVFQQSLQKDVASFLESQQQQITQRAPEQGSLQDPEVTSAGQFGQFVDYESEDTVALTIRDSETGIATAYDAYVIYADKDFAFVKEMITQLEDNFGLRLCISNRDMLAGSAQFQAIAAMIKKRCSKVIVVMSPAFRDSPMCTFATNFAFSLCPSTLRGILVPILYAPCKIPDILLYIAPLDFTKVEYIQWFWQRLQHSLRPIHVTTVRNTQQELPPPYEDTDMNINNVDVIPCDSGKCTRDPVVSMTNIDGAIGGTPSSSGKRKKTSIFNLIKPKSKPQSQRRPTHTTSHVMIPESS